MSTIVSGSPLRFDGGSVSTFIHGRYGDVLTTVSCTFSLGFESKDNRSLFSDDVTFTSGIPLEPESTMDRHCSVGKKGTTLP